MRLSHEMLFTLQEPVGRYGPVANPAHELVRQSPKTLMPQTLADDSLTGPRVAAAVRAILEPVFAWQ